MNLELTEEQRSIRNVCREFAEQQVAPNAARHDRDGSFPYEIVRGMAQLGLFALPFPQSVGGAGGDFLSYCVALEEIARADASCAITLEAAVSLGIPTISEFGTPEQR